MFGRRKKYKIHRDLLMKPILNQSGKVIGYTREVGTRQEVRDRSNALVAWYDTRQDKTFKKDGSPVGFGNQAIRLLKAE
jgi:hypothetical protein